MRHMTQCLRQFSQPASYNVRHYLLASGVKVVRAVDRGQRSGTGQRSLEIVGESMGLHHEDHFKRLKMLQDIDAIAADCSDLISRHGLDPETTRQAIAAMLQEQPLPLRGGTPSAS